MQQNPAIVIIAYNRLHCLQRLVGSVLAAHYPEGGNVPLIISIDKSNNPEVQQYAETVEWTHGDKKVICHSEHLGLKEHVLRCGDLTEQYDSIIMLEDDLLVSPWFYDYSLQTAAYYKNDERIAGVSLYRYFHTENYYYPFHPIDDGFDIHFIQLPSSWGQMFSASHWKPFKAWLQENGEHNYTSKLPIYLANNWTKGSWKKHFVDYMINRGMYFVYPNTAVSTNYGEEGTNSVHKGVFQVPLLTEKES
ncbi:MAG: glycosyltransferase family 2 protein [Bacteroidetes bacterium]|nr:glycosyltransferase family 2 protein [Bacteroidota bacterium]